MKRVMPLTCLLKLKGVSCTTSLNPSMSPVGGLPTSQITVKTPVCTTVPPTISCTSITALPPKKLAGRDEDVPNDLKLINVTAVHVPIAFTEPSGALCTNVPPPDT